VQVGFQVGALGPLVPGVDADDRVALKEVGAGVLDEVAEPGLVTAGRRALQHRARALAPGVVIPGGHAGLDEGVGRGRLGAGEVGRVVVGVDLAREIRVEQLDRNLVQHLAELVRRELDRAVEAVGARVAVAEGLGHDEQRVFAVALPEQVAPAREGGGGIGHDAGAVEHEQRPALDADVARVREAAGERGEQIVLVARPVVLGNEHVLLGTVPAPGPVLVGPHQAEREVNIPVRKHGVERRFQQAAAVEGVEIPDEAFDPGAAGEVRLLAQGRGAVQPIMPEVARDAGLVVPGEPGQAAGQVGPFREPAAPPAVVLRDGVELGEVEGEHAREPGRLRWQGRHVLEEGVPLHVAPDLARDPSSPRWAGS
jgi:hypothetical protein